MANTAPPESGPMPIGNILAHHAGMDPSRPAATCDDLTLSFADLDARSNRKARQLAALDVGDGDVVTLAVPNGFEFYETAFAIWKLGATPNIVSSKLPAAELRTIVEIAHPRLIMGEEHIRVDGWNFLAAGTGPDESLSTNPLPTRISPRWKMHTSGGSTGRPKLIVDKQTGVFDPNVSTGLLPGEAMLNPGPLYHNAPLCRILPLSFLGKPCGRDGQVRSAAGPRTDRPVQGQLG